MAEPSLSELTNIPSDAALGTAGLTDFVPKMHEVNQQIFEAAKFKANMDYSKYLQQLQNFKEIVKDGREVANADVAAPDREILQKQMADIFSEIEKNPKSALSGNGMFDIQDKMQKVVSDATQSKQDNLFDKYHRQFLDRVPDMKTDENKAKVETFLPNQKLGTRQPYMLDAPEPEFNAGVLFDAALKNSTRPFSENNTSPTDKDGKPLKGFIQTETGDEVNPQALVAQWNLALTDNPKLGKAITKRYNDLPEKIKKQYDAAGGVAKFFDDLGKQHLNAHFPEGTYDKTKDGNYRFNKKSDLKQNPNYLGAEKLALEKQKFDHDSAIDWAKIEIEKNKGKGAKDEDKDGAATVINEAASIINKGEEVDVYNKTNGKKEKRLRISDPTLLATFGNIDKDGKVTNVPNVIEYNRAKDQATLIYYKDNDPESRVMEREVPLDQRTWLKHITKRSFPNKEIGGINGLIEDVLKNNENSLYKISQKQKEPAAVATEEKPATITPVKPASKVLDLRKKYNY